MASVILSQKAAPENPLLAKTIFPSRHTVTCEEVAKLMGVSRRHIINLCQEGTIQAVNVGGKTNTRAAHFWRIPVAAYDAWIKAKTGPAY